MLIKDWKKEIMTIPNLLSLFRIALIPVYMLIYLNASQSSHYFISAAILAVSCLTDLIDGKIARHFNMISTIGKILDPLADKATQFTLIICLTVRYPFLWYLVGLFVIDDR
jgi:cardiolipin synthase